MRIAFVGKGGSGKTTLASLMFKYIENKNQPLLAIDADINQHLGQSIGWDIEAIPELGNNLQELKTILKGRNPNIPSENAMTKTTLPGRGSHLIRLEQNDPILERFARKQNNAWFMRLGGFQEEDIGQKCYHAKTGAAELVLNHLIDQSDETVLLDMTAGADAFASGFFTRFDLTVLVVEPTLKSTSVYSQYKEYTQGYDIPICVIGNKIEDDDDVNFIREHCGQDLIGYMTKSSWVKKSEQSTSPSITTLEPENKKVLELLLQEANKHPRDWQKYWQTGQDFHSLNVAKAKGWANEVVGLDLTEQTDPDFTNSIQGELEPERTKQHQN